jgi:replicative DNA helicase
MRWTFQEKEKAFFSKYIDTNKLCVAYLDYSVEKLCRAIRHLHTTRNPSSIYIDYIQLLTSEKKGYARQEEMKAVCMALKNVAIETGLPIILGSQFNRSVINPLHIHANRVGEAGDIERIANVIIGIWNCEFEIEATATEQKEIDRQGINIPKTIYAKVLKYRDGERGMSENLYFAGNTGKITNKQFKF